MTLRMSSYLAQGHKARSGRAGTEVQLCVTQAPQTLWKFHWVDESMKHNVLLLNLTFADYQTRILIPMFGIYDR